MYMLKYMHADLHDEGLSTLEWYKGTGLENTDGLLTNTFWNHGLGPSSEPIPWPCM